MAHWRPPCSLWVSIFLNLCQLIRFPLLCLLLSIPSLEKPIQAAQPFIIVARFFITLVHFSLPQIPSILLFFQIQAPSQEIIQFYQAYLIEVVSIIRQAFLLFFVESMAIQLSFSLVSVLLANEERHLELDHLPYQWAQFPLIYSGFSIR